MRSFSDSWFRSLLQQITRAAVPQYLATGILVYAIDYAAFFCSYSLFHFNLATATAVAYILGLVSNFLFIRFWVFARQSQDDYFVTSVTKYVLFLTVNFFITYAMLKYQQQWFGISPYIGKFIVAFFMTFWNYFGFRLWVFKGPKQHLFRFGL